MRDSDSVRVAAIQAAPVFLDTEASLEKAIEHVRTAAGKGATLAAFGEGWLPGYPIHCWSANEPELWWELAGEYLDQAIEVPGPETEALCSAAREVEIDIVIGVAEKDSGTSGSVYSTLLFIGGEGELLGRHRKLRPAMFERVVWADGDTEGLYVHEREYGRLSGMSGWDHQMGLPAYHLAEQGTQIHVAAWPGWSADAGSAPMGVQSRQHLLSQAFASQTASFVICAGTVLSKSDLPSKYQPYLTSELSGGSAIISPTGEILKGPVEGEGILSATCEMADVRAAKVAFDCAGHAARPDQLMLWNKSAEGGNPPGFDDDHEDSDHDMPPEEGGKKNS